MTPEFNEWWDGDDMTDQNPYDMGHPIYWAWEGWCAGIKAERKAWDKVFKEAGLRVTLSRKEKVEG